MGVRRDNYPLDSVPVLQCCPSLPECNAALRCTRCTVHNRNSPWPIEQREHWIIRYCLRGPRCLQACNLTNFLNDKQWQYIESGCVEKKPPQVFTVEDKIPAFARRLIEVITDCELYNCDTPTKVIVFCFRSLGCVKCRWFFYTLTKLTVLFCNKGFFILVPGILHCFLNCKEHYIVSFNV